jgi:F-type H+-transporting ATPase subunit gamma
MADTLENLKRRKESAAELSAVVRTMKALAAANIGQCEMAVKSLNDYYKTVSLGVSACFRDRPVSEAGPSRTSDMPKGNSIAIVFGSDQGLVGRFNNSLAETLSQTIKSMSGDTEIWVIGDRMVSVLGGEGYMVTSVFPVPNSIDGVAPMVNQILTKIEVNQENQQAKAFRVFHNAPADKAGYYPVSRQLLPLDSTWQKDASAGAWPTKKIPQVIGGAQRFLPPLVREYLFMLLYKACAESMASENASRLEAMQRAEKNIGERLDDLKQRYNRLRQSTIDEELFDVIAGFEALNINRK